MAQLEGAAVPDLVRVGARNHWPNASAFVMGIYCLTRVRAIAFRSALLSS